MHQLSYVPFKAAYAFSNDVIRLGATAHVERRKREREQWVLQFGFSWAPFHMIKKQNTRMLRSKWHFLWFLISLVERSPPQINAATRTVQLRQGWNQAGPSSAQFLSTCLVLSTWGVPLTSIELLTCLKSSDLRTCLSQHVSVLMIHWCACYAEQPSP